MDARTKHYRELREQMVDLKKALHGVANLDDDFTGKGADNIKSFYKELAGNVDMFISFIDKQIAFHEGVSGTLDDTSFGGDTFVEEHFLDNAVHMGIKNAKSIVKDQKNALKTIFEDIDDLISLEVFDSQTFDEKIEDAEDERKKTVKNLSELDQNLKDEYALSETEQQATMALYAEMMNATNDGKSITPMNFDKKAFQDSEIYKAKSDIEKQTAEYLKIKKEQEEAREIAKEQAALANRPWYEKALDYGGNIVNELTGVNDAKRAATGIDPITGEELTAGQRVAAGGMAAAGYIPIVGWAGRIFKGGKAVYKTTQTTSAAVRAVDIYKTSQKSFDALKTSQKGLYGLTATNGFSEAITGRDMFGNKISKEQQEASMNAALGMLLPLGAKGFHGKMGIKGPTNETYQHLKDYKNNKYFTRSVEYNAGKDGTGFTYKVYQRGDINWDLVRTRGAKKGRGLTNAEASAKYGLAPILDDAGSVATLHHSQQKGVGPLYEASTRYHNISNAKRAPLHPYKGKLNPFFPMDEDTRGAFQKVDSINYWKLRGEEASGGK
ncbi:ribonuclease YeeF family protein [Bacillus altitudinis]|uniref:ribonuclease YeeF family protein n=1 Tax=Bacillus altitudinis TaxID=293387 RepID=UPI001F606098|nr:T7SS effector LXG polymorphic toxin [Bacillus altitudinis]